MGSPKENRLRLTLRKAPNRAQWSRLWFWLLSPRDDEKPQLSSSANESLEIEEIEHDTGRLQEKNTKNGTNASESKRRNE